MSADVLWEVTNTKEGCREVIVMARKKEIVTFEIHLLAFKTGTCLQNEHCFPRQNGWELNSSLHHWLVQTKEVDFIFYCWVHIKFFMDKTLQNLLVRNLKLSVFMRHLLESYIPVVTSSLQEIIRNSFLEGYLIRHIKVSRIIRMDVWTKSYLPCLPGCVYIKT